MTGTNTEVLYSPHGLQFRDNDLFEFSSLNAQLVAITEK